MEKRDAIAKMARSPAASRSGQKEKAAPGSTMPFVDEYTRVQAADVDQFLR